MDPGSTSGYLMPRYFLRSRAMDPKKIFIKEYYSGNHLSVMKDVIKGVCHIGAVYSVAMISARNLSMQARHFSVEPNHASGVCVGCQYMK